MEYTKNNPLRCFFGFAGYDSQALAFNRLKELYPDFDYTIVGWSEIDPYAIKAHNALFPEAKDLNYGDVTKIDWSQVPDFDFMTYSSPCFPAGTLVLTGNDGFVPIEEVEDGDLVITHTNQWHRVTKVMERNHIGEMYHIRAMATHGIDCTPEHPFYVRKRMRVWNNDIRRWKRVFGDPEWVEAKDLTKDMYLGVAVNHSSNTRVFVPWEGVVDNRWGHGRIVNKLSDLFEKPSFWYLMGRYVADGWKKKSHSGSGIVICCGGRNRQALIDAIDDCGFNATIVKERTVEKFIICSNELNAFVDRYGYYAHGKKIDRWTMWLPTPLLTSFIRGYEAGDGDIIGNLHKITSVSKELIYGIAQCIATAFHCPYKIYYTPRPPQCVIEGRTVNQRGSYQIVWKEEVCKQDKAFYDDGYIWTPISKITTTKEVVRVYNLEVEDDHSYTANGIIVHNCQDFSNAGKQAGGEEGSGTRSSLLWEVRKAVIAKRPKYLMMENVKSLVSAKFLPLFQKWEQELASYGYSNYCKVLNAKDYGIPQNRERIFVVSILDEGRGFDFGDPFELKLRLKDMLEEKVDEKYYLDQERVNRFIENLDEDKRRLLEDDGSGDILPHE